MADPADSPQRMRKAIGLPGVFAICTGAMLSSGFFLLPGLVAEETGPAMPLAYLLAGASVLPALLSLAELASAMPRAGGPYYFLSRSLGPLAGTIGGFGKFLQLLLKGAFAFVGAGTYLSLLIDLPLQAVALGMVALFVGLNLIGARQTARAELALVAVLLVAVAWFLIAGGLTLTQAPVDPSERFRPLLPFGVDGLLTAVALVFVSYGGVGQIGSLAEEVRQPARTIPQGALAALGTATFIYVAGSLLMLGLVPAEVLRDDLQPVATTADTFTPLPFPTQAVVATALAAFLSTGNAAILSAARYPVAMARDRLVWPHLAQLAEDGTPRVSVLVTGVLLALIIVTLDVQGIAKLAGAFLLLVFGAMCVAVVVMRESGAEDYQPGFRSPLYPWTQAAGVAFALLLIAASGWDAIGVIAMVFLGSWAWHRFGVRDDGIQRAAAIHQWMARVVRDRWQGARAATALGLSPLQRGSLDALVDQAVVVELEDEEDLEEALSRAAEVVAERVGAEREGLAERLASRARTWTHPVAGGLSIAPLLLEGIERPEMVLVNAPRGVRRGEETLHALIFMVEDTRHAGRLLSQVGQLTETMRDASFLRAWREADDPQGLKEALHRGVRTLTLEVGLDRSSAQLVDRPVAQLDLPEDSLAVLIQRDEETLIPRPDTRLRSGDHLTIVGRAQAIDALLQRFGAAAT